MDFAEAAAGAGGEPADVVRDFHEIGRECLQCTVGVDQFRLGGQRVVLIFRRAEGLAGELGDGLCGLSVKALRGIQTGADSGAAERQRGERRDARANQLAVSLERASPTADFLGEGNRNRILEVGSAGFHDALIAGLELPEAGNQCVERGQKFIFQSKDRRDVHCGREGVV